MSHIAPIENNNINSKSNFNAVKIKVNNPKTYIPEESQNNGIYNAVDIEVNNPTVTVIPTRKIYSYPEAKDNNSKVSNPINVNSLPNTKESKIIATSIKT